MFIARWLVSGLALSMGSLAMAGQTVATGDFNGDGRADLAIGVPFEDLSAITDAGVVHVLYGRGGGVSATKDDIWNQNRPGMPDTPEFGDHFGRALAAGDFNGDGFDDLAISADEDGGVVHVLFGSAHGLVVGNTLQFTQDNVGTGSEVGSSHAFGASLATGDFNADGFDDLVIGEPNDTVYHITGAGSVTILFGAAAGLGFDNQWWHQEVGAVGEVVEAGDNFGSSLAAGDFDGDGRDDLAIGVPLENIGSVPDAGIVQVLYGSNTGLTGFGSEIWQQNSSGVADLIENGDSFGTTLAAGDFDNDGMDDLAIGVQFEKIDGKVHAGAVHVLYGGANGLRAGGDDFWHQNRGGIADECELNDEFGSALAVGDFNGDGRDDLAIGVRAEGLEDVTLTNCGAVEVLYGTPSGLTSTASQFWTLNSPNVPGKAGNAQFGQALAAGDFDGDGFADLAVAAPGESLDAVDKAGAVHVLYGSGAQLTSAHAGKYWHQNSAGIADECEATDGFGGTPPP